MKSMDEDVFLQRDPRPAFLTVLCILTFIGSGWSILSSAWTYSIAPETAHIVSTIPKPQEGSASQGEQAGHKFEKRFKSTVTTMFTERNLRLTAIVTIISSIFTLLGAILMWRLNRKGYYLYILGIIFLIAGPLMIYGSNFLAVGMSSFSGFFGLLFIALYSLNLSSMPRNRQS
jgi:hypothetical protein